MMYSPLVEKRESLPKESFITRDESKMSLESSSMPGTEMENQSSLFIDLPTIYTISSLVLYDKEIYEEEGEECSIETFSDLNENKTE